jgi:hypothetical protein
MYNYCNCAQHENTRAEIEAPVDRSPAGRRLHQLLSLRTDGAAAGIDGQSAAFTYADEGNLLRFDKCRPVIKLAGLLVSCPLEVDFSAGA